ncbi:MAG: hypothetical protein K2M44_00130 [Clostridia bacterium]|nr:hypothetical protein [Clostridia bacterium]
MKKIFTTFTLITLILVFAISALVSCNAGRDYDMNISLSNMSEWDMSEQMYGIFLEDISYAGDGGLISEMVNNNSFEYASAPTAYWNINGLSSEVKNDNALNSCNPHYLRISVDGSGYIENIGYIEYYDYLTENYNSEKMSTPDMGLKKDVEYDVSLWVRNISYVGEIKASLVSESSCDKVGFTTLPAQGSEWKKISARITSSATADGALRLELSGRGEIDIDFISLTPRDAYGVDSDNWKYVTLRRDLYDALVNLNPAFIRFPGGCLAEGDTLSHLFSWKDTIGPLEEREHFHNIWRDEENGKYYNNTFALGYHEYFQLCEDLNAKAVPILNAGMICQFEAKYNAAVKDREKGKMTDSEWEAYLDTVALRPNTPEFDSYIQDIFDLVEYANGDKSTYWGAKRAENGHPEPFNMEYIGIGNENWGELYFRNFDAIYNAVKEKYPNLQIVSSASYQFSGERYENNWQIINEKYSDTIVDEHYYTNHNKLFNNNDRYDSYDRSGAKVFIGEYAAESWGIGKYLTKNNMWSAIEEAGYLTAAERNGDVVVMTSYAPTFAKLNAQCWKINMIWFDSHSIILTPNYYTQMMFANNTGKKYISTDLKGKDIYSSVTVDEDTQSLYIKLVNAGQYNVHIDMNLDGFATLRASNMQYISGVKAACNEPQSTTVVPVQSNCAIDGQRVSADIKPYSVNVVRVFYGDNDGSSAYALPDIPDTMYNNVTQYTKFFMTPETLIGIGVSCGVVVLSIAVAILARYITKRRDNK